MIRITLQQRSDQITAKRAAGVQIPPDHLLANTGQRRTPQKRDLLRRLEQDAAAQGRTVPFKANV